MQFTFSSQDEKAGEAGKQRTQQNIVLVNCDAALNRPSEQELSSTTFYPSACEPNRPGNNSKTGVGIESAALRESSCRCLETNLNVKVPPSAKLVGYS